MNKSWFDKRFARFAVFTTSGCRFSTPLSKIFVLQTRIFGKKTQDGRSYLSRLSKLVSILNFKKIEIFQKLLLDVVWPLDTNKA
jgi:hypothetical protein